MISKYHPSYLTDCLWSIPRAGLFFVSRTDGWINAYDLCYKINESAFSYKVSESSLTTICLNMKGDKLMVGDEEGKVSLIKLSKSFYSQHDNENKKDFINKLFDREANREKSLELMLKKKGMPVKEDLQKLTKQEQTIKDKIKKIENDYIPFVNKMFQKSVYNE